MGKVNIYVWHDVTGKIVAIGRSLPGTISHHHVIPLSGENQLVLETEIEEENIEKLHQTHVVDARKKALVKLDVKIKK